MFIYIGFGAATDEWLSAGTVTQWSWVWVRDEKEPKTSKNKANQNPGFAKNQTEPKPESEMYKNPNRTIPSEEPSRTWNQMSGILFGSFTEWNCTYIHTFYSKGGILLYLG